MTTNKGLRVMLVDDSDTDLFINETMIKHAQFSDDIISFTSSTKALEYLKGLSDSDLHLVPDYIFLDINMPLMNGFEFIKEYQRLSEQLREKSNIVLLSSTFNSSDYSQGYANKEVVGLLAKPLTLESLKEMSS